MKFLKSRWTLLAIGLVSVCLLTGGFWWWNRSQNFDASRATDGHLALGNPSNALGLLTLGACSREQPDSSSTTRQTSGAYRKDGGMGMEKPDKVTQKILPSDLRLFIHIFVSCHC